MMIKVEAIVREEVFEDVKEALNAIDVNGITVSQVMGCGAQRGYKKRVRGTEVDVMMQPKIKFEIVVSSEEWEKATIDAIQKAAFTGKSEMERFSAMRSVLLQRSVPERAGLTP
mgnify:FL=1